MAAPRQSFPPDCFQVAAGGAVVGCLQIKPSAVDVLIPLLFMGCPLVYRAVPGRCAGHVMIPLHEGGVSKMNILHIADNRQSYLSLEVGANHLVCDEEDPPEGLMAI